MTKHDTRQSDSSRAGTKLLLVSLVFFFVFRLLHAFNQSPELVFLFHIPLTTEPAYWIHVTKNSPPNTPVAWITAIDGDRNSKLTYQLKVGNPQFLFDIDPNTGTRHFSLNMKLLRVDQISWN
jgi:hypothetical protein